MKSEIESFSVGDIVTLITKRQAIGTITRVSWMPEYVLNRIVTFHLSIFHFHFLKFLNLLMKEQLFDAFLIYVIFSSDDEHWQSFSEYEDEYAEEPLEPEHVEVLWMDNLKLSMVLFLMLYFKNNSLSNRFLLKFYLGAL